MSSIFDTLAGQLGSDQIGKISSALGADKQATGTAVTGALSTMLGALARNAGQADGATALHDALKKDHDGGILGNLGSHLDNPEAANGAGILKHMFGGKQAMIEQGLGRSAGLDSGQAAKLMAMLAPIVLGALAKNQKQNNLGPSDLAKMLGQERQHVESRQPAVKNLMSSLLDTDGDGDLDIQDIAKHGKGILGKLFGR